MNDDFGGLIGMVDASVPVDQFVALGPEVQAEMDKWKTIGDRLAESWKRYTPGELTERADQRADPIALTDWKRGLTGEEVISYLHGLACEFRGILLDSSSPTCGPGEGYLILPSPTEPFYAEFRAPKDSLAWLENPGERGFISVYEGPLTLLLEGRCGVGAWFAMPYIRESLRGRALTELSNLQLTDLSPSIIKVTLEQKVA